MIEPGWYDDPADPTMLRWWDGSSWTEHTQPAPTAEQPPAGVPDIADMFGAGQPSTPASFNSVQQQFTPVQPEFTVPLDARWAPMPADVAPQSQPADPFGRPDMFGSSDRGVTSPPAAPQLGRSVGEKGPRGRKKVVIGAVLAIVAIAGFQALSTSRSGTAPSAPVAAPGTPSGTDVAVPSSSPSSSPGDTLPSGEPKAGPTPEPTTPTGTSPSPSRPTVKPPTSTPTTQNGPTPSEPNAIGSAWGPTKGLFVSWVAPLEGPRPERYEVTVRWNDSKTTVKTKNTETSLPGLRITKDCAIEVVSILGTKKSTVASARCGV